MEIGSEAWIDIVLAGAARLNLTVSRQQAGLFARHAQLLMEWNRKINLTAITEPTQVAVKHYLDAIAPLNHIPAEGRLLDIGTGGGFPGIPLKIMRPGQPMTLIDSVRKKVNFVKYAISRLGLDRIEVLHMRAQEPGFHGVGAQKFEVIVCRALADLHAAVQMAVPLLSAQGCMVAFLGPHRDSEPIEGRFSASVAERLYQIRYMTFAYQLPFLGDHRSVAILKVVND